MMSNRRGNKPKPASRGHKAFMRGMASQIGRQAYKSNAEDVARNYRLLQRKAFVAARVGIPSSGYVKFFEQFAKQYVANDNLLSRVAIGSDYMNGMIEGSRLSLSDELTWTAARISAYSSDINVFLESALFIDEEVWGGNAESAIQRLVRIEADFGISMWLLGLRIALEQQVNGLEAQKHYVGAIRAIHKAGIIPYVSHHLSVRNEPNASWAWYVEDTKRRIDQSRFSPGLKMYFKHHFLDYWPASDAQMADILRYEQSHSIVDIYETFISFAQYYTAGQGTPATVNCLKAAIETLSGIVDPRLHKLRHLLGLPTIYLEQAEGGAAYALLKGNPASAYRSAVEALKKSPTAADKALVAAFARAASLSPGKPPKVSGLPVLWTSSLIALVGVFGRGRDYYASLDQLRKLTANFRATSPAKALAGAVSAEASPDLLRPLSGLRLIALNLHKASYCDVRAGQLPATSQDLASAYFEATYGNASVPKSICKAAASFAAAIAAARSQDWATAAECAAEVQSTSHEALRRRATLLEATARVRLDQVQPVIESIEREVALDGVTPELLPHVAMIEGKTWTELREASDQLGLAIALDLALKASGNDKIATHRRFAYDAFLTTQKVDKASELDVEEHDPRALTYYLKNVAVPSVLDMSEALEGTRDIQEERRAILSILTTLDLENASEYQDEILDITDQLALAEGLKLVDSSRIHVDTDAIEAWSNRELADGYNRYRTLLQSGIGVADDFDLVLANIKKSEDRQKGIFAIPVNEADDLLITIVQQLLDRFLYDPAHGLDSYLSRRIRHGSIVGFLRGPVEETKLISLRDETDSSYALNTYWLEELSELSEEEKGQISGYLEEFARSYDNALIRLRDELIQLKDKEHPNGLIDMRLYADLYYLIRSAIKESGSFSLFVASCFASFWGLLDRYLQACREEISTNLRASLGSAFDTLRGGVNQLYNDAVAEGDVGPVEFKKGLGELTGAITTAQTNLQAALEDVQTWFARSEVELARRIYTLRDALNVAIQSALIRLRSYTPEIQLDCDEDIGVPAEDLSTIAEIMLVTLTNACEHSGEEGNTVVDISVRHDPTSSMLTFRVVNAVEPSRRTSVQHSRVDAIRDEIATSSATAAVRRDRRSGLRKLGALKKRFQSSELEFGFADDGDFKIRIAVPFETAKPAPPAAEDM